MSRESRETTPATSRVPPMWESPNQPLLRPQRIGEARGARYISPGVYLPRVSSQVLRSATRRLTTAAVERMVQEQQAVAQGGFEPPPRWHRTGGITASRYAAEHGTRLGGYRSFVFRLAMSTFSRRPSSSMGRTAVDGCDGWSRLLGTS